MTVYANDWDFSARPVGTATGDVDGAATWRVIIRAIEELQRTTPREGVYQRPRCRFPMPKSANRTGPAGDFCNKICQLQTSAPELEIGGDCS